MINNVKCKGQIKHYQDMNDMDYIQIGCYPNIS